MTETPDADLPHWPFRPNWATELTETLDWKTRVLDSKSGAEQRMALRLSPRRIIEYEVMRHGSERTYLELLLHRFGASDLMLPLWHDAGRLAAEITSGATALPLDTTYREFEVGGYAWIQGADAFKGERVLVEAITDDGLTIAVPGVFEDWSANTKIFPMRRARLTDQPDLDRKTSRVMSGSIRFELCRTNDWAGEYIFTLYRGNPVLTLRPEEGEDMTHGRDRRVELLDNDTGKRAFADVADRAFATQEYRWWLYGREAHASHRDLLYALQGRYKAIWVPTYNDDLFIAENIALAATQITVRQAGYTVLGAVLPGKRDIRIELKNGTVYHRRITGLGDTVAGYDTLLLDSAIPAAVAASAVLRISFMDIYRLNQDVIEIAHLTDTDGSATSTAAFRAFSDTRLELPDNYVPIPDAEMTLEACGEGIGACLGKPSLDTGSRAVRWFPVHTTRDGLFSLWAGENTGIDRYAILRHADHTWTYQADYSDPDSAEYIALKSLVESLTNEDEFGALPITDAHFQGVCGVPGLDSFLIHTYEGGNRGHSFILMDILEDGTAEIRGHCWTNTGGTPGVPGTSPLGVGFAGGFAITTPLVAWMAPAQVAAGLVSFSLDSVFEMMKYKKNRLNERVGVFGSDLSYFLVREGLNDTSGAPNWRAQGFFLSGDFYFLVTKDRVKYSDEVGGALDPPYVDDTKAGYPNGWLFRIDYTFAGLDGPTFGEPVVVNDRFDMNGPPFADDYLNTDGSTWDESGTDGYVGYNVRVWPIPLINGKWLVAFHKNLPNIENAENCGIASKILLFEFGGGDFKYKGQQAKKTLDTVTTFGVDVDDRYITAQYGPSYFYACDRRQFLELFGFMPANPAGFRVIAFPYMNYTAQAKEAF